MAIKNEAPAINAATRKKLITLVTTGRDLLEKAEAILQEIDTICAGGASVGEQLKALQQAWNTTWSAGHNGDVYLFTFAKDVPAMKRLLKAFALEDLQARMVAYMKDDDPFYVRARHPFGVFAMNVNRWTTTQASVLALPPVGCAHTPACRSDQEHTQKRQREMRA